MKIYNTSPHNTRHENGVWEGNVEEDLTLVDNSKEVDSPLPGVTFLEFRRNLSTKCVNRLKELASEYDLILLPAMYNSVPKEDWADLPKGKFVAYIATPETQRSKPQDKVACSTKFSLIW